MIDPAKRHLCGALVLAATFHLAGALILLSSFSSGNSGAVESGGGQSSSRSFSVDLSGFPAEAGAGAKSSESAVAPEVSERDTPERKTFPAEESPPVEEPAAAEMAHGAKSKEIAPESEISHRDMAERDTIPVEEKRPIEESAATEVSAIEAVPRASPYPLPPAISPVERPAVNVGATTSLVEAEKPADASTPESRPPKPKNKPSPPIADQLKKLKERQETAAPLPKRKPIQAASVPAPEETGTPGKMAAATSLSDTPPDAQDSVSVAAGAKSAAVAASGQTGPVGPSRNAGIGLNPDYLASLRAWLEEHKRYPRRARLRRQQGVVLLSFSMDRAGNLLSYDIARSSGHPALDGAVRDLIRRAVPLPRMPDSIRKEKLHVSIPIEFQLK